MFLYMTKCDDDCNNVDNSASFFKVQQLGFESTGTCAYSLALPDLL